MSETNKNELNKEDETVLEVLGSESSENDSNNIVPTNELASQTINELENELALFRFQWKRELLEEQGKKGGNEQNDQTKKSGKYKHQAEYHEFPQRNRANLATNTTGRTSVSEEHTDLSYEPPKTNEEKASYLFNKGVLLEQQGRFYEAIKFYRMSMQLDADIEFKVAANKGMVSNKKPNNPETNSSVSLSSVTLEIDSENKNLEEPPEESDVEKTLYEQFQSMTLSENRFCERNFPQKATHFSQLPIEVIMLILKWVVSQHLDMRSLDSFSAVCKGFYVCARDPEIWKQACAKIWGANNISNHLSTYSSWREMYLNRPRLNFDGVYISKASYARAGEQSLDNFYRPWHLVEYYRYFRFFANGSVLFLTTPEDPKSVVYKLKPSVSGTQPVVNQGYYSSFIMSEHTILRGTWTLALNKVSIVLVKKILKSSLKPSRKQSSKEPILEQEHIFRMELVLSSNDIKRLNNQLSWANYEIDVMNKITSTKNNTKFDLNKIDFPNFYFSRVRSYSTQSDSSL